MKSTKPIRLIIDYPQNRDPENQRWTRLYECPVGKYSAIVFTNDSDEWGCSCPRWVLLEKECHHIRRVKLEIVFAQERGEEITTVSINQIPQKTKKAESRFSNVEV